MIQKLSSIKPAFYNLVFLVSLMGTGVYLGRVYKQDFQVMNAAMTVEWLKTAWSNTPVLAVWFILLCISATFLFVNVLCCSLTKQIPLAVKSGRPEKWLFFVVHGLFIIILVCHGLILVVGSKTTNIRLFAGESIGFETRYTVDVSAVVFQDDITILNANKHDQRALMTRQQIHRTQNYAQVALYEQSALLASKKISMLSPLRHNAIQVTLTNFIVEEKDGQERVGITLTLTRNYLNTFFFVVYGLMILTLGAYGLLMYTNERP
jgi:hypothetical protein